MTLRETLHLLRCSICRRAFLRGLVGLPLGLLLVLLPSIALAQSLVFPNIQIAYFLKNSIVYPAVANTATETLLTPSSLPTGNDTLITAGVLNYVGRRVQCNFAGVVNTVASPQIQLRVKLCPTIGCGSGAVNVLDTGAVTLSLTILNAAWRMFADASIFAVGANGSTEAQGWAMYAIGSGGATHAGLANISGVTFDTTKTYFLAVSAQWSAADPSNTIQLRSLGCTIS